MDNNHNNDHLKKIQDEIRDMQVKYTSLTKEVEMLQNGQKSIHDNINAINSNFDKMNANIENMMEKINKMVKDQENSMMGRMMHTEAEMIKEVKRPIRKLAVGTISTLMTVADVANEAVSNIREGFEDIFAEAQYQSRKRRMNMSGQPQ